MIALALAALLMTTPGDAAGRLPGTPAALTVEPAAAPMLQSVAVTLECTAFVDGRVGDCQVLDETHPGLGFGEAAIALMADAEVAPGAREVRFARTIQFMP